MWWGFGKTTLSSLSEQFLGPDYYRDIKKNVGKVTTTHSFWKQKNSNGQFPFILRSKATGPEKAPAGMRLSTCKNLRMSEI